MDDKKDKKSGVLSAEDAELWQATTRDIKRMPGKAYLEGEFEEATEEFDDMGGGEIVIPRREASKTTISKGHDLDGRTEERLRKGQMSIEARLDLHHMNQDQAHEALNVFIASCYAQHKRCVLVITGKGKTQAQSQNWFEPSPGILKQRVPDWLRQAPIKPMILKVVPAQPKDGGDGALYVLLRRQRTIKE